MVHEATGKMEVEKIVEKISASGRKIALPDESLDIVKLSGVDVPAHVLVKSPGEAIEASAEIGFPLVMKIASTDAIHKSEAGGVVLGIQRVEEVEENYNKIMRSVKSDVPDTQISGILLQKQVPEATQRCVISSLTGSACRSNS